MYRTAEQTAVLIALLFKKAEQKRARVSEKTIRFLSKRTALRVAFLDSLTRELDDLGIHAIELGRGGFGLIPISALDGAPGILAKSHISDELRKLKLQEKSGSPEKFYTEARKTLTIEEDDEVDEE